MSSRKQRDDETVARAEVDLKRLGEQSEKLLGARHAGDDDDSNEPAVIWGKRIGRILAYALGIYLVFWFLARYGVI